MPAKRLEEETGNRGNSQENMAFINLVTVFLRFLHSFDINVVPLPVDVC